ncbi:cytosine/creatinine deaminase [Candidatus Magnetomoraceae bacterium gMMP-15]
MNKDDTIEMLVFNLKLIGKKRKKNVLISAGTMSDKEKMLPAIKKLSKLNISVYATKGTSGFLNNQGITNQEVYKITKKREPNIKSFLEEDRFDLVINVLTGDHNYDESSDSKLIRCLSIENGIPLITDVDVAILTIEQMVKEQNEGVYKYKIADKTEPWNLKLEFFQLVDKLKGFACYHAHFDKAYLISKDNLKLAQVDMQKKWELYKYLKENYTHQDLVERISRGVEKMIDQGVTYCRTFVDADSTVKLLPIKAALEVRKKYNNRIKLEIGVQPLQGILEPESRKYFIQACELADVIGGLPSKDRPMPEKHLDYIMDIAKDMNKKLDVHIDQENNPFENETELLALKTMEHGLEGRVSGIHAISIAAKPKIEQERIIKLIKDAGMNIIICPSAALSMKQLDLKTSIHNSVAPLAELIKFNVPVFLGVDNIYDLFMPFVDGDIWFECRMLMEACRFYDIEKVAKIACNKDGFR